MVLKKRWSHIDPIILLFTDENQDQVKVIFGHIESSRPAWLYKALSSYEDSIKILQL